jgi:16S rRNA (guanine966-N2)-methyltransferase
MRVISGTLRGRSLDAPPGRSTRPVTDRFKESLFNLLTHRIFGEGLLPDAPVLDLFAGSGALGIEALSRGAGSCVFVENDRRSLRSLRGNLERLGLMRASRLLVENAWAMRLPRADADGFGLVFVDPPYRDVEDPQRALDLFERLTPRVAPAGYVVFRCAAQTRFPTDRLRGLRCEDERTFGRMRLLLLRRADPGS